MDGFSGGSGGSSSQNPDETGSDICKADKVNAEQLDMARNLGLLESCPNDEVEGELIYFQHRLLENAVARKRIAGMFFITEFIKLKLFFIL